jgi:hypothetical protein
MEASVGIVDGSAERMIVSSSRLVRNWRKMSASIVGALIDSGSRVLRVVPQGS